MPTSKKRTKPSRRSKFKYPAIEKQMNLKSRQPEIDDVKSYFDTLPDDAKEWMNRFMEEYNNANFNHGEKPLHKTKTLKKDCYNRNNRRNRCISSKEEAKGILQHFERLEDMEQKLQEKDETEEIDIYYEPKMKIKK